MHDAVLLVLGTWGITEFVRHEYHIRVSLNEWLRCRPSWVVRKFRHMISCGFCVSCWAALLAFALLYGVPHGRLVLAIIATVRLANILNDLFYWCNRSPNKDT